MEKFLKDRKGSHMTDVETYCRIATSIKFTIDLQEEIDKLYEKPEKSA